MVGLLWPLVPSPIHVETSTHLRPFRTCPISSFRPPCLRLKPTAATRTGARSIEEEDQFQVLTALDTEYNRIVVLDTPKSRILLLDSTHNIHSIYNKENEGNERQLWTGSYWDEFASLPAIVPRGPIAILGLGGGTSAHLMLHSWPSLRLHGWEIDEILIHQSREYFGLSDLETSNQTGGLLTVHLGDALSPSASVPGGFAGIVVDLFSEGKVLPQLQEVTTWLGLKNKLMCHGRIMVNCAGADAQTVEFMNRTTQDKFSSSDDLWIQNSTIKALNSAFPGNLSWKVLREDGENYLAVTGPFPNVDAWSAAVPAELSMNVKQWRPCHKSE